ncbi:starch phosphorylase [Tistlia consotensis]|uniref:Alpha-1,4 glucan phosphorylase n=1 Tax=Tistlia consotensis USBA 355 TaxID=560819 RepID=A0A1Y6BUN9_9PROT|nr:glycogen/starch/alpha-glucan phosphorylase [Tistlia consotensis]SMF29657.1 starch phosphorylase [Tistlia consotensis USBA 355]SNR91040.1 starch phosphorylase [Tistlia consotensis]
MDEVGLTVPPDAGAVSAAELRERVGQHLVFSIGRGATAARLADWRLALSYAIRDRIVVPWFQTAERINAADRKRVYYLSMEFLIGRLLDDAVANLGLESAAREAMAGLGVDYDALVRDEPDAALGNGGLGRLAACFLDSMSAVGVAGLGYGIRYDHGLFRQSFEAGWQAEEAEDWLAQPHPWEFERPEASFPIGFGGSVGPGAGDAGAWHPAETVIAVAYDTPVPGWQGRWVNTLRLWSAKPTREFELQAFNRGDFLGAATPAVLAETISRVLYPDDSTPQGRELRLKQEYFFTAASIRDILQRFERRHGDLAALPDKVAIQLNDTHPAIAGPELIRLLVDERGLAFDAAFDIARGCLHYTNHTLLPEALERWPAELLGRVLPCHLEIVERIDARHARESAAAGRPSDDGTAILGDGEVRMGTLAFVAARRVNGVSALHTRLMQETVFGGLHALHPERIVNQTNGVTPRRWLHGCNPPLRALLQEAIGDGWVADLDRLEALVPLADDAAFRERFAAAKRANKVRLAPWLAEQAGIELAPETLLDVQIKRFHEYKRQLLNLLETVALWNAMRQAPEVDWTPRVKVFGGKAAPGYRMAKLIIKLINDVARTVNDDPAVRGRLQVAFPPNYNVSMAERLIPAADLSEQISTAGLEASGTGNMKLALNGALTVGTLDGANVEIRDRVGEENIFIFGLTAEEVARRRAEGYAPAACIAASPRLAEAVEQIASGRFSPDEPERFRAIVEDLRGHDRFLVCADFEAYWQRQRAIDAAWRDRAAWTRSAVLNVARCGWFSSDRAIRGYAKEIWNAETEF